MAKKKLSKEENIAKIIIRQTSSSIGCKPDQISTLVGLGFSKNRKVRILDDTASIRGMINKVKHLVKIENSENIG